MKVGKWSTAPANNNATPPDGWPEGQAPSTVNDCARENMAAVRVLVSDLQFVDLGHSPSYLTATTFSLGSADSFNFEVGRRLKLFDATTLYGTINSVSGTFVSVRLDSGALTSSLTSVAVGILHNSPPSLPEAAYSQQNVIINGDMDIWQRGDSFPNVANGSFTSDRFMFETGAIAGNGNITRKQQAISADMVPTVFQCGRFINNSLAFAVSATQTTLNAGGYAMLSYSVEGFDFRNVAFQPFSLSFWANCTKSGIYSVVLRGANYTESYVTEFTVSVVNSMQKYFLQLPPLPVGPLWNFDNQTGLRISWVLAAGTNWMVNNTNSWTATNLLASPNQANLYDSPSGQFAITGISVKSGWADVPLVRRLYKDELGLCHRYYWRGLPGLSINFPSYEDGTFMGYPCTLPVPMRIPPALSRHNPGVTTNKIIDFGIDGVTNYGYRLWATGLTDPGVFVLFSLGTDYFEANAELT